MAARFDQSLINDASSGIKVEIKGLSETLRNLDMAGNNVTDMRELMHSTGEIVARRARSLVPVESGTLRASIKAGRGKTKAVVRAGSPKRAPYAGYTEYPAGHLYMTRALAASSHQVLSHVQAGLADLLKKNRLI